MRFLIIFCTLYYDNVASCCSRYTGTYIAHNEGSLGNRDKIKHSEYSMNRALIDTILHNLINVVKITDDHKVTENCYENQ